MRIFINKSYLKNRSNILKVGDTSNITHFFAYTCHFFTLSRYTRTSSGLKNVILQIYRQFHNLFSYSLLVYNFIKE